MAIDDTDWTIDRVSGNIRYIGDDHNGTSPTYATVIQFHRWLQSLADDAVAVGDDELDITNTNPSQRSTDNIITLINGYNIDDNAAEHLYDGSIIQDGGDTIYDGIVNFGNAGVIIQIIQDGDVITDDWWNYSIGGTHTGAADASVLTDSSKSWTADELIGYFIYNIEDGSFGLITDNDTTTVTADLYGGTENDWDNGDSYLIAKGLNQDLSSGISHRFMIKVTTGGSDIDGRKLVATTRRWGFTFSEFTINATNRGNNVLALSDASDINNTTSYDTVDTWSTITNLTEGYASLDVNNDGSDEHYYSEWDISTYTINQFYERMKYLTTDGSGETLYGLSGELFRGITHEVTYSGLTGSFDEGYQISWSGASVGTGQVLADNGTDTVWLQILTGSAPSTSASLSQSTPDAASATVSSVTDRSATIAKPFIGISTGNSLIGAYGVGVQVADLTSNDKVKDLTDTTINPPNYVQNTVSGLVSGEDRVLVCPWDGSSYDSNGDPAIQKDQLSLDTALTTDNITEVEVTESIPSDTPSSGYIRVTDNDGFERRLHYSNWENGTPNRFYGIDTSDGNEDFGTVNASAGNNVWIAYIDELASGTSASFTSVQSGSRDLVVIVRDGGATPIKQFISAWSQGTSASTINAIRTTDE